MKCIRSLAVALSLMVTAFTSGAAQAEPHRDSPFYYLLGANAQQASLMSTAVEHHGQEVTDAWVLVYLPVPIPVGDKDGTTFQALWFLTEFNCRNSTAAIKEIDVMAPDGTQLASKKGGDNFSSPAKDSYANTALQLACDRDYPAKVLTAKEAMTGLAKYSRAAQAALAAGAADKNDGNSAEQN